MFGRMCNGKYKTAERVLQFQEHNQFHGCQQPKSKADTQYSFPRNGPMCPTLHYHAMDDHPHKKGLQQTT